MKNNNPSMGFFKVSEAAETQKIRGAAILIYRWLERKNANLVGVRAVIILDLPPPDTTPYGVLGSLRLNL
jgi:hypothetical protein